jgi:hypothetical protein
MTTETRVCGACGESRNGHAAAESHGYVTVERYAVELRAAAVAVAERRTGRVAATVAACGCGHAARMGVAGSERRVCSAGCAAGTGCSSAACA